MFDYVLSSRDLVKKRERGRERERKRERDKERKKERERDGCLTLLVLFTIGIFCVPFLFFVVPWHARIQKVFSMGVQL